MINAPKLKPNDKIGIICCSNGQKKDYKEQIQQLCQLLHCLGLHTVLSPYLYQDRSVFQSSAKQRAEIVNAFFADPTIAALFDISGGDIANEILDYLNYPLIARNPKPFFGYSDLTCVLNAIYAKTGVPSYLYQLRHLLSTQKKENLSAFQETFLEGGISLYQVDYHYLQGNSIAAQSVVVGGNLRCFLKLSGTSYMPVLTDKLLFLEALSGEIPQITAFFAHLRQMKVFSSIRGLLLGTFTELEQKLSLNELRNLLCYLIQNPSLPILKTQQIGHHPNSKCLAIGHTLSSSQSIIL